ncbi:MAG: hypothetical protein ACYDA1_10435 [Vulcanimicrobiaceae bacterium]
MASTVYSIGEYSNGVWTPGLATVNSKSNSIDLPSATATINLGSTTFVVYSGTVVTPTPSSSPTASPSPTIQPTSTPTVAPTPTATPTATPMPTATPTPIPTPSGNIVLSPSTMQFVADGAAYAQIASVSEAQYNGTFTITSTTCTGIVTASPNSSQAFFTITPIGAGDCWFIISDSLHHEAYLTIQAATTTIGGQ